MSGRPFKLQLEKGDRKIGIVISSLKELEKESMDCGFITSSEKNRYKIDWNFLCYSYGSGATTLEDGTIVDSEKYFDNLPDNTVFVITKRKIGKKYQVRFQGRLSEVIANSLIDLRKELRAKFGDIKPDIKLDDDYTEVDSERYFNTLPENTILFVEKKPRSPSPYRPAYRRPYVRQHSEDPLERAGAIG